MPDCAGLFDCPTIRSSGRLALSVKKNRCCAAKWRSDRPRISQRGFRVDPALPGLPSSGDRATRSGAAPAPLSNHVCFGTSLRSFCVKLPLPR